MPNSNQARTYWRCSTACVKRVASYFTLAALVVGLVVSPLPTPKTAEAADTGAQSGTSFAGNIGAPSGDHNWSNASNAASSNDSDATVTITSSSNVSNYLRATGFGFSIPTGSTINGITVNIERSQTSSGGNIRDNIVSLVKNNVVTGSNKGATTTNWPNSDGTATYGSTSDLWGTTWTYSDINDSDFGVVLSVGRTGGGDDTASVDHITIAVTFTEPPPPLVPAANPTLGSTCGLDVALVVDTSGSISDTEMSQMKSALTSFTTAFTGTPTVFSLTRFSSSASVVQGFSMTPAQAASAISGLPIIGSGLTNWEAGLTTAWGTYDPRSNPNLVIFTSDGNPTTSNGSLSDLDDAIVAANVIKNAGTRIITLGIGNDLNTANLEDISGTGAVYTSNFATLATDMAALASELCGGTITVTKIVDTDGNPNTTGDQSFAQGWTFDVAGESKVTDANGQTMPKEVDQGTYSVTETVQTGYTVVGASCTGATTNGSWNGNAVSGIEVGSNDIVACTFYNTPLPSLTVYKTVVSSEAEYNLSASDFSIHVKNGSAEDVAGSPAPGNAAGTTYYLAPGSYFVSEEAEEGYTSDFTGCNGNEGFYLLNYGDNKVCNIVNTEVDPPSTGTLVVTKVVVNNSGGQKTYSNFPITVKDGTDQTVPETSLVPGGDNLSAVYTYSDLTPGSYTVSEPTDDGYAADWTQCNDGTVSVSAGQVTQCTITNDDKPGKLIVIKEIVNADASYTDFYFSVNDSESIQFESDGSNELEVNAGTYTVVEVDIPDNYTAEYECSELVVANGGEVTCTITNTYNPPVQYGSIHGYKWNDEDGDGQRGEESLMSGWRIFIDEDEDGVWDEDETYMDTDDGEVHYGWYWFENLPYGTYEICEVHQSGWTQTYPASCHVVTLPDGNPQEFEQLVNAVDGPAYNFGNQYTGEEEVDVCLNIDGIQTEVPSGYTESNGQCTSGGGGGGGGGGGSSWQLIITNEQILPEVTGDSLTATITWTTNHPATSRLVWDTVSHPFVGSSPMYGYAFTNTEDPTLVVFHTMTVTGLTPGQTYYFRPISHGSPEVNGIELAYTPPGGGGGAVAGTSTSAPAPQVLGATDTSLPRTGGMPLEGVLYLSWIAPLLERFRNRKLKK